MQKQTNYQKELDTLIFGLNGRRPRLLLHACCAPCASYCLEYLAEHFDISLYYYNPNISEKAEYERRRAEAQRLVEALSADLGIAISYAEGAYEPERFLFAAKGLEACPEGGQRCEMCFRLRLLASAEYAAEHGFDYFTTSLTISPLKNAGLLNEIGRECAEKCGIAWLPSDFKKKGGYKRSVELSEKYGLYRQDYCGCVYSRAERERQKKEKAS